MAQVSIASGSQISAGAGAAVADKGGNAVDAALAAALVSMCTDPGIMAPGASGFITIWPPSGNPITIDAYTEMPGRGLPNGEFGKGATKVFLGYGGGMHTLIGYKSIATPGAFAGLSLASEEYGVLPWAEIVAPTLGWIERGFPLSRAAAEYLDYSHEIIFGWHPDSYQTLHQSDGSHYQEGDIIHIPGLANSLRLIAEQGADTVYTGELGNLIAAELQANGGLLTAADLAAYQAIPRSPISIRFGDWEVVTNPPPAVGGACLAAMLLLLDQQPFKQWNPSAVERLVAIQQAVLDYRTHHFHEASNNLVEVEAARLLELAGLSILQTLLKSPSTIHTSAVDSDGWACSISASAGYGSGVMVSGTGLWLNNSLGELELHPQGLQGILPGTRLVSNMAPTIARRDDGTILAIGSPGASRITTAIVQVLLNFIHLEMSLLEAVAHPRLHVEVFEGAPTVAFESGLTVEPITGFVTRCFPQHSMYFGGVQAALWNPTTGLSEAADPRRAGGVARGGTF